jgi:SAM-dependent methyltransferase
MNTVLSGSDDPVIYEGLIRNGAYGKWSRQPYAVRLHGPSDSAYLDPFPDSVEEMYASGEYREQYNDSTTAEQFEAAYDSVQGAIVAQLDLSAVRGRTVVDFGSGGGSFLDLMKGIAGRTIAVEPNQRYHDRLRAKGHQVFSWGEELVEQEPCAADWACAFQVIEHVRDPVDFLRTMAKSLREGGSVVVTTPNRHDILGKLGLPEFDPFRYRTAHLWYLSKRSLAVAAEAAGLELERVAFLHRYDLGNLLAWVRDRRPRGRGGFGDLFDSAIESSFRGWLEDRELADCLWAEMRLRSR